MGGGKGGGGAMYKLMLVDDEDEVREGIEATVDFESCGFTLCAQATGAIDAIEED